MKTIAKLFICFIAPLFIMVSCEEDSLDPLAGKYTAPEEFDLTSLESQTRVTENSFYIFSINLKDNESNTLNLKFVAADYILPASDFTPSEISAKNTYLIGSNGSTCNGQQITDGTITVAAQDSNYTMNGILYLADEKVIKMTAEFTITYQPDLYIPTYTYSTETETPAMGGQQGDTEIEGTTKYKITVNADGEFYAYFELITEESATSLTGTYIVKDGLDAAGQAANGFYFDWSWYGGTGIMEGGSYYIKNDQKMFIREGDGAINVADNDGTLSITGENLGILDLDALISSSGATWQNLAETGSINIQEATKEVEQSYTYVTSVTAPATYGLAGTEIAGSQLNVIKIVNANNDTVAVFELISDEGSTDLSGDYNVLDGTSNDMTIGDANNGYYLDYAWYGTSGINVGGCYYTDGNEEIKYIRSGSTIHVENNSGALSISGNGLALLDLETLINSAGATWQNLAETGNFSYTNIAPIE